MVCVAAAFAGSVQCVASSIGSVIQVFSDLLNAVRVVVSPAIVIVVVAVAVAVAIAVSVAVAIAIALLQLPLVISSVSEISTMALSTFDS